MLKTVLVLVAIGIVIEGKLSSCNFIKYVERRVLILRSIRTQEVTLQLPFYYYFFIIFTKCSSKSPLKIYIVVL